MNSPEQLGSRHVVDCAGARLHVYARSLATVLRVDGDIDAANAGLVAGEVRRFGRLGNPLILDLSHLTFLGIDGFRALLALNHEHHQAGVHLYVVTGRTTRQLMCIVKDHGLATVGSVPEALQLIEDAISARRKLLSGLARQRQTRDQ